jgi:tetratricopeptide (TPR) repeat protein
MVVYREPSITVASVEAALESLKYTTKDVTAARSLYALSLVDAFLDDPAVPASPLMRDIALHHVLTDLITRHYQAYHSLPVPSGPSTTDAEVYARIQQDVAADNPDIIGWSLLYYLYVITAPSLTQESYAQSASIVARTVYRYKKNAIKRLTHVLIEEEWQVRRQRQRQRLLASMPSLDGIPLIGREKEMAQIESVLREMTHPCITISGAPGCGKSALVWEVVKHLIAEDRVSYLFWFNGLETMAAIEDQIRLYLQAARLKSDFGELVAAYPVVVILENSERLTISPDEWDDLLSLSFGRTITLITGQEVRLTQRAGVHLVLHDLEKSAVESLVWTLLKSASRDVTGSDGYAEAVWQHVGGNPQAIRLVVGLLEEGEVDLFQTDILSRLYARLDGMLDRTAQRLWDILTLFPQGLDAAKLRLMVDDVFIVRLRQQGLITPTPAGQYVLSPSARLYRQMHPCDGLAWAWAIVEQDTAATWGWLAAAVLAHLGASIPYHSIQPVLHRYQADIQASSSTWRAALDRWQPVLDVPLQLAYAMSLFHRGETEKAEGFVLAVIQQAGRQGDFMLQASALLSYSALCRQQGRYADALRALDQSQRVPCLTAALQIEVVKERLQIALDQEDRDQVVALLPQLIGDAPQIQLLRLEAAALLGTQSQTAALAEHLRAESPDEEAWVLTILGRSAHDSAQFAQAADYFQAALLRFEQRQDIRAVSRAQMNLAASLIQLGQRADAKTLLDAAAQTLAEIQDRVGLSALRANLDYLSRINRLKHS